MSTDTLDEVINEMMYDYRRRLRALSNEQFNNLYKEWLRWFMYDDPEEFGEDAITPAQTRTGKIGQIMDTDPVMVEGGLFSFLEEYLP